MSEQVNHPAHYQKGGRECIDVMIEKFGVEAVINFCDCNQFKYEWRAGLKEGNSAETDRAKAAWYKKKAEELKGNTLSSEIKPLSEEMAQQLADTLEKAHKVSQEFYDTLPAVTNRILDMVEDELRGKMLINLRRLAESSFLTRWYWKRKVEKSKTDLENILKATAKWREENLK